MGLFDKLNKKNDTNSKEQIAQAKRYVSNIGLEQLGFMEQLDREVVVISDNGNIAIDHAIHMCITQDALGQTLNKLKQEKQKEFQGIQLPLGMAVDNVIQQQPYEALIIYGLAPFPLIVSKEDLMPIKDLIDSFCIMYAAVRNTITNEKAFELMKTKMVYIIGTMPTVGMKKGDTFGFETIKRKIENGEEYEAVKCFLTKESAEKYNGANREITAVLLMNIKQFFGTVIIEPHRNYWIEFR